MQLPELEGACAALWFGVVLAEVPPELVARFLSSSGEEIPRAAIRMGRSARGALAGSRIVDEKIQIPCGRGVTEVVFAAAPGIARASRRFRIVDPALVVAAAQASRRAKTST